MAHGGGRRLPPGSGRRTLSLHAVRFLSPLLRVWGTTFLEQDGRWRDSCLGGVRTDAQPVPEGTPSANLGPHSTRARTRTFCRGPLPVLVAGFRWDPGALVQRSRTVLFPVPLRERKKSAKEGNTLPKGCHCETSCSEPHGPSSPQQSTPESDMRHRTVDHKIQIHTCGKEANVLKQTYSSSATPVSGALPADSWPPSKTASCQLKFTFGLMAALRPILAATSRLTRSDMHQRAAPYGPPLQRNSTHRASGSPRW